MVGEVEEVMAERWARYDGQWCSGGSERARQRRSGNGVVLSLLWRVKERQREGERARVSERGGFASLFSPYWPDQLGADAGMLPPCGACGLGTIGHDGQPI